MHQRKGKVKKKKSGIEIAESEAGEVRKGKKKSK